MSILASLSSIRIPNIQILKHSIMVERRSSDYARFKEILDGSKNIVALTGAGISAESGVPTFRGDGGFWRNYRSTDLATPQAFRKDPSLVWQFYEYRRQLVATKLPNNAHKVCFSVFFSKVS